MDFDKVTAREWVHEKFVEANNADPALFQNQASVRFLSCWEKSVRTGKMVPIHDPKEWLWLVR